MDEQRAHLVPEITAHDEKSEDEERVHAQAERDLKLTLSCISAWPASLSICTSVVTSRCTPPSRGIFSRPNVRRLNCRSRDRAQYRILSQAFILKTAGATDARPALGCWRQDEMSRESSTRDRVQHCFPEMRIFDYCSTSTPAIRIPQDPMSAVRARIRNEGIEGRQTDIERCHCLHALNPARFRPLIPPGPPTVRFHGGSRVGARTFAHRIPALEPGTPRTSLE